VEDAYIRIPHQIQNFVRFCELVVHIGDAKQIDLVTGSDDQSQKAETMERFQQLEASLSEQGIQFNYAFNDKIHDREIKLDNGWLIKIGRGFDLYQKPDNWFSIGASDLSLRPCLETKVDIFRV
jgi:ATP-dependent Lon protease